MHVLHVITTLGKGGAESHLVDLCRALRKRGVSLTVIYLKGDGYWVNELELMGVKIVPLKARRYADPGAVLRLRKAVANARPDIVHAHMPPAELYAVLALRGMERVRLVVSKHNDQEPFYRGPGSALIERFSARRAHAVIAISEAVRSYFATAWPAKLGYKLVTVRYGLTPIADDAAEVGAARALRQEWGIGEDDILYGTVARLVEQKSIPTLLRAFGDLRNRADASVRLVLVGQGPLESELRALADELGISDVVVWAGFRTDIPAVMRSLDVFVLSSIYEGFGLVLLEAMEASLPIVASKISAIPEIVVEGETGYLVPSRDPQALADAMALMLAKAERRLLGQAGHDRLLSDFVVDRMADETMSVYRGVLSNCIKANGSLDDY